MVSIQAQIFSANSKTGINLVLLQAVSIRTVFRRINLKLNICGVQIHELTSLISTLELMLEKSVQQCPFIFFFTLIYEEILIFDSFLFRLS